MSCLALIAAIIWAWKNIDSKPRSLDLSAQPTNTRQNKPGKTVAPLVSALSGASQRQAVSKQSPTDQSVRKVVPVVPTRAGNDLPQATAKTIPIYSSFDFLKGYLTNLTSPVIVDGKPWDFGSTNFTQLKKPQGGTKYWDYWGDNEAWDSANHLWRDDQGNWHTYKTETIQDSAGHATTAYVLLEKNGPGVMDKLWFTQDASSSFWGVLGAVAALSFDPPDLTEWGRLSKLGNLRIEVDDKIVFDGPIETWFSGDAQHLSNVLKQIFVWRYRQFGSDGNIIPIPYQNHIKVSVYGGTAKPKWFMATGMTLPPGSLVKPYTGSASDLPLDEMQQLAQNVLNPEQYINSLNPQTFQMAVAPAVPAVIALDGSGTVEAIQFKLSKQYDPRRLWLRVMYGNEIGIDLPLLAFFSEPDQISLHHSAPIGLIDTGETYLFYSNFPMPYQDGIRISLFTDGPSPIPMTALAATTTASPYNTQLRVFYKPSEKLQVYGPDFVMDLPGNGKLVGLVLVTKDQAYDQVPLVIDPNTGKEVYGTQKWPLGYLEGKLTLTDGIGNTRHYTGQEDWTDGGYYFNWDYTLPPGGSNRPFGGILRYAGGANGYETLFRYFNDLSAFPFENGLHLSFGHGTFENNFSVSYGATAFYYHEIPGMSPSVLPPSDYTSAESNSMSKQVNP